MKNIVWFVCIGVGELRKEKERRGVRGGKRSKREKQSS